MSISSISSVPATAYASRVAFGTDGKTVATLSNSGALRMRMDRLGQIPHGGPDEDGLHGPALAQFRAEKIAKALGGEIAKRDTAMTQEAADPPRDRKFASAYGAPTASARDGRGTDLSV